MSLLLAATLAATVTGAGARGPERALALKVVGNTLVDAQGDAIRLLGVDRSGAEYACVGGWGFIDGPTDQQSIAAMTAWHINAVRLPLNEDCWLGINGVSPLYSGAPYQAAVVSYVRRLHAAGLYVIIDLHWSAPGSTKATGQQEMADLTHAPAFWSSAARAFRTDPAVIFDLYNEPHGIDWSCWRDGCQLPEGWRAAGMQALVNAVRSTGAQQPIIATGLNWGNDLTSWLQFRPRDPARQVVAGFHAFNFTACTTRACWIRTVAPVARKVPVITTELGEADCSDGYVNRFTRWADSAGVSYLGWSWNPAGCSAPSLISSWDGTPTPFGEGLRTHLLALYDAQLKGESPR
jgi:endoglucanase